MELKITTIGQLKNSPFLELQNDYVLRNLNFSKSVGIKNLIIQELPISRKKSIKERKKEEAEIKVRKTKRNKGMKKNKKQKKKGGRVKKI